MSSKFCRHGAAVCALIVSPIASHAITTYASATDLLLRGSAPGDMAGFYGGSLFGAFPVALTDAQARAAVLGAPDGQFLSLPGGPQVPNTAFSGAYVEVSFGADFSQHNLLTITELGDNQESAQIFLWTNNGGNFQIVRTRGASDDIVIDLSSFDPTLLGGTAFSKVGIGGLDENGASKGFDLDAVAITAVPEPSTYALMLAGLGVIGWLGRRRQRHAA